MTKPKVFICPRPDCDRVSDVPAYCRHGLAVDLVPGNWMRPWTDPTAMPLEARPPRPSIPAQEIEEAKASLLAYARKDSRDWIRSFELRTLGAPGKSMAAIDKAFAELIAGGELEDAGQLVRLPAFRTVRKGQS